MPVTTPSGFDESVLVSQAREGDTRAFGELVRRYEGKIFRLAQHVTNNREDAEDVLQETFMKAYEHLDQFKGDSKFYTWIVRIAVNQALMKLRRRRTDKSVSLDEQIASPVKSWVKFSTTPSKPWSLPTAPCLFCATWKSFPPRRRPRHWVFPSRLLRADFCGPACSCARS